MSYTKKSFVASAFHFISTTQRMSKYSSPREGDGSGSSRFRIGEKVPRFFKIVTSTEIDRLRLPTEFTRRYWHNLPDCISLKVPSGLVWKVGLIRSSQETWLHEGWQRFQEYYSIHPGHLLLFEFVDDSHFAVHIFDTSATEIEYFQYENSHNRVTGLNHVARTEGVESESNDSDVFLEDISRGKDQDVADVTTSTDSYIEVTESKSSDEHIEGTELKHSHRRQRKEQSKDAKTIFKSYTKASVFMSEKPNRNTFCIVAMSPSYVNTRKSSLQIPATFAKEMLPDNRKSNLIFVCEGKTWLVSCTHRKRRARITSGWSKFVKGNELKVGDTCVFEVVEGINLTWNVTIFRG